MNNKYISLLTLFLAPLFVFANTEDDVWSYVFHLEYQNGSIVIAESAALPYSSIPVEFPPQSDVKSMPFYGEIISIRGKSLALFGFQSPTLINTATGVSPLEVRGPYFANADHVSFYKKGGKHLFDISVARSSFCNDDNVCNVNVGENYRNCPNDCPTTEAITSLTNVNAVATSSFEVQAEQTIATITPEDKTQAIDTSYVVTSQNGGDTFPQNGSSTKTILSFIGGILVIIFALVVRQTRKNIQ